MYYKPPMVNPIITNAVLLATLEANRRKRAREIDQYFVYLSTFDEENYWFNRKLGGYEIYYEQNENSKKWNSKDEGYWGYPSLYFKIDTIFNLVPDEIVDSIVNKDKTFGLYYLDFYKYLDLDQVYIPYENEEGFKLGQKN